MMGARFDFILHLNVSLPDGSVENAMQWLMEDYRWNVTMIVKGLVFHAQLHTSHLEKITLLNCNFCDEYPMDMELYKEVFNTVLLPQTFVVQTYFNPVLAAIPIYWPAEIMNIG